MKRDLVTAAVLFALVILLQFVFPPAVRAVPGALLCQEGAPFPFLGTGTSTNGGGNEQSAMVHG